jgi:hypothetical protein
MGKVSRDKAGQALCAPEVPSGYLAHSAPWKIGDICHQGQAFNANRSFGIKKASVLRANRNQSNDSESNPPSACFKL